MIILRQSTASQEIPLGQFLDSTDGDTEESALTIANTDIKIWKTGASTLANKNSGGGTYISNGVFYAVLDATDTDTLGSLIIFIHVSGALAVRIECLVLSANIYDSLIAGTDYQQIDVVQLLGTAWLTPATAGTPDVNAKQIGAVIPASATIGTVTNITNTVTANLTQILGTALTETAGYLAAGFKKFFNIASPALTVASIDQTGDSFNRIGAAGAGLTSIGDTRLANLNATISSRSSHSAADVWAVGTRTLTSFGTLVSDTASAVWTAGTRTLTSFGSLVSDVASAVWSYATRLLTGGGDATAANQTAIINHLTGIKGSGFNGTTDSLEAIRDRGDQAWITGGGSMGSNSVTLTIQDGSANNIVETFVEIWDNSGTTFYERKISNSSGKTTHNLDNGTYTIKLHKAGYNFSNHTLIVDGIETVTYTGEAVIVSAPTNPEVCRIFNYFYDSYGNPVTALSASIKITRLPFEAYDGLFIGSVVNATYSSATGLGYWDIVRGAKVKITCHAFGLNHDFNVPDMATAELTSLINI